MSSASVHWFDSLVRFIASIPYFDSLIRFTESIHWFDSLGRFIDSIHWFDSLIRFFGSILWFDSNIQEPMGPPGIFIGFKMWKTIGFIACSFPKGWKTSVWSILKCETIIICGFFLFFLQNKFHSPPSVWRLQDFPSCRPLLLSSRPSYGLAQVQYSWPSL